MRHCDTMGQEKNIQINSIIQRLTNQKEFNLRTKMILHELKGIIEKNQGTNTMPTLDFLSNLIQKNYNYVPRIDQKSYETISLIT